MFIRWHLLYWQHVVSPIFMYENGKLPHHAWTKCSGFSISQSLLISNLHLHDIIPFPSSKLTLSLGWQTDHLCHCCNHQRSLLPLQHQAQCLFVWWTDHHHLHRRRHRHKLRGWLTETPQNWNVPEIGNLVKIYPWKYFFTENLVIHCFTILTNFFFLCLSFIFRIAAGAGDPMTLCWSVETTFKWPRLWQMVYMILVWMVSFLVDQGTFKTGKWPWFWWCIPSNMPPVLFQFFIFLATLVALHFTPVSKSLGRWVVVSD